MISLDEDYDKTIHTFNHDVEYSARHWTVSRNDMPIEFSIGEIVKLCHGISRSMIRHILENLRKEGKLKSLGAGRNAKWRKL